MKPGNVAELLKELIAIPSVNPECDPDQAGAGEQAIADHVAGLLKGLGAEVALEEVEPGRPNVVARFPTTESSGRRSKKRRLLFGPHLDTVGVQGMKIDPFAGEERDGKIYGRGACDTKGTMAAMLMAFAELGADAIAEADVEVAFAGFCGEEFRQPGSRAFIEKHKGEYDFAIVGEPTGGNIVFCHKGCLWARIITEGSSAHGSTPDLGVNAIHKMGRLVDSLNGSFRHMLKDAAPGDKYLSGTTINIGKISGGSQPNIVADHCEIEVDIRFVPLLSNEVEAILREFVEAQEHGAKVERIFFSNALENNKADEMIVRLLTLPVDTELVGASWFCDGAVLAAGGLPAVAAGPGDIAQAHTADEWISIEELERGVEFYKAVITG
jgi:acetylornithine deacetylase/succinyl-diaminopimelate desuccinylase family protein